MAEMTVRVVAADQAVKLVEMVVQMVAMEVVITETRMALVKVRLHANLEKHLQPYIQVVVAMEGAVDWVFL